MSDNERGAGMSKKQEASAVAEARGNGKWLIRVAQEFEVEAQDANHALDLSIIAQGRPLLDILPRDGRAWCAPIEETSPEAEAARPGGEPGNT